MSHLTKSALRRFLPLWPLVLVLALAGCASARFNREWQRAARAPAPAGPLEGRWEGHWLSGKNGHTGRLRCVISHTHGKNYRFDYSSTFWKYCHYRTTLNFRVEGAGGVYRLAGEENLGDLAGGVYRYEGSFNGREFTATYTNRYDHGTFEMRRVE